MSIIYLTLLYWYNQASIESYYSIASEGDGDIFASAETLGVIPSRGRLNRQTSFCLPDTLISEYSEFNDLEGDLNSSISDLFSARRMCRLGHQSTLSEHGSILSLSIDKEEIMYDGPVGGGASSSATLPSNSGMDKCIG